MPYLEALGAFRAQVREAARAAAAQPVLALCDALRDTVLPELGVRLEDRPGRLHLYRPSLPTIIAIDH